MAFESFVIWGLQAIIAASVGVAYAVIGWLIKSHLALQRLVDREYVSRTALAEILNSALKPIQDKLDVNAERQREREEYLKGQLALMRSDFDARETQHASLNQELATFVRDVAERLELTARRDVRGS